MIRVNTHINFNGNAEEAFTFYKSVFGGKFAKVMRLKDLAGPDFPVTEADAEKVIYIALPLSEYSMLIGNDVPEFLGRVNERENRSKISLSVETKEEADRLYAALTVGGEVEMPLGPSPWGTYYAMFRDKYGIEWVIEVGTPHELKKS